MNLKNNIFEHLEKEFGANHYVSLKQAIDELHKKGELTKQDATLLKELNLSNDKHLNATWEAY